jgi:hypothetical protein
MTKTFRRINKQDKTKEYVLNSSSEMKMKSTEVFFEN